ncbi:YutD family protein [Paenibacillus zanthoxyli]|uniref:YutD family protein n=1 Tax=Paenibacillus zanthoxyli TaxID=369399 RepID=UPI000470AA1A|nr:YutD family protein [Paenibacillus zanthoxyli]
MIIIGGKSYELMVNHKEGWNPESFRGRYSEVLDRYDYIVGDWGYNQLRLKGFYRDNHPKVNRDTAICGLVDYINEYCNFGCAYFVLRKLKDAPKDPNAKDILIKEPGEVPKEIFVKEAASQETSAKKEAIPQLSSRKFQAESAVSREQPVKEFTPKERPFKERSRDNRNKEYQGKKSGSREIQAREAQGLENQGRENQARGNQNRDYQNREAKARDTRQKPPQGPAGQQ